MTICGPLLEPSQTASALLAPLSRLLANLLPMTVLEESSLADVALLEELLDASSLLADALLDVVSLLADASLLVVAALLVVALLEEVVVPLLVDVSLLEEVVVPFPLVAPVVELPVVSPRAELLRTVKSLIDLRIPPRVLLPPIDVIRSQHLSLPIKHPPTVHIQLLSPAALPHPIAQEQTPTLLPRLVPQLRTLKLALPITPLVRATEIVTLREPGTIVDLRLVLDLRRTRTSFRLGDLKSITLALLDPPD